MPIGTATPDSRKYFASTMAKEEADGKPWYAVIFGLGGRRCVQVTQAHEGQFGALYCCARISNQHYHKFDTEYEAFQYIQKFYGPSITSMEDIRIQIWETCGLGETSEHLYLIPERHWMEGRNSNSLINSTSCTYHEHDDDELFIYRYANSVNKALYLNTAHREHLTPFMHAFMEAERSLNIGQQFTRDFITSTITRINESTTSPITLHVPTSMMSTSKDSMDEGKSGIKRSAEGEVIDINSSDEEISHQQDGTTPIKSRSTIGPNMVEDSYGNSQVIAIKIRPYTTKEEFKNMLTKTIPASTDTIIDICIGVWPGSHQDVIAPPNAAFLYFNNHPDMNSAHQALSSVQHYHSHLKMEIIQPSRSNSIVYREPSSKEVTFSKDALVRYAKDICPKSKALDLYHYIKLNMSTADDIRKVIPNLMKADVQPGHHFS